MKTLYKPCPQCEANKAERRVKARDGLVEALQSMESHDFDISVVTPEVYSALREFNAAFDRA